MRRITPVIVLVLAIYVLCWAEVYSDAFAKVTTVHTVTALASGRSLPKAEAKPEYRFLIYQPKSAYIPMPVPVQQETQQPPQQGQQEQGAAQQPQQGTQQQQAQPPAQQGQQQYRQGEPGQPEQQPAQPQPERTYGWGYAWWWWIVIAAIIIFFIIIFAAWGGWGGRGGPP